MQTKIHMRHKIKIKSKKLIQHTISELISFDDDSVFFSALDVKVKIISWNDFFSISWLLSVAWCARLFSLAVAITFFSIVSCRCVALLFDTCWSYKMEIWRSVRIEEKWDYCVEEYLFGFAYWFIVCTVPTSQLKHAHT